MEQKLGQWLIQMWSKCMLQHENTAAYTRLLQGPLTAVHKKLVHILLNLRIA